MIKDAIEQSHEIFFFRFGGDGEMVVTIPDVVFASIEELGFAPEAVIDRKFGNPKPRSDGFRRENIRPISGAFGNGGFEEILISERQHVPSFRASRSLG